MCCALSVGTETTHQSTLPLQSNRNFQQPKQFRFCNRKLKPRQNDDDDVSEIGYVTRNAYRLPESRISTTHTQHLHIFMDNFSIPFDLLSATFLFMIIESVCVHRVCVRCACRTSVKKSGCVEVESTLMITTSKSSRSDRTYYVLVGNHGKQSSKVDWWHYIPIEALEIVHQIATRKHAKTTMNNGQEANCHWPR